MPSPPLILSRLVLLSSFTFLGFFLCYRTSAHLPSFFSRSTSDKTCPIIQPYPYSPSSLPTTSQPVPKPTNLHLTIPRAGTLTLSSTT